MCVSAVCVHVRVCVCVCGGGGVRVYVCVCGGGDRYCEISQLMHRELYQTRGKHVSVKPITL